MVLQCAAAHCRVLQGVAGCCRVHDVTSEREQKGCCSVFCSVLQYVAVCCSVLLCFAVYCSVLQCVLVH